MATIAMVDNIHLKMYHDSLFPPHFMAVEGEKVALFNLHTLELIDSDLSALSERKVMKWADNNRHALIRTWHNKAKKLL